MIQRLFDFLADSPVNFLAVKALEDRLQASGFTYFDPSKPLPQMVTGGQYYTKKNDSSLYAFRMGKETFADAGMRLICAHCDSPTFRIKPAAEMVTEGMVRLNTEVYGGPIMSTWMDRPLSLAGRVIVRGKDALHPETLLLHVKRPLLQISNLAIHFNRQVNDGVKLSKQKDMLPILALITDQMERGNLLVNLIAEELKINKEEILDFDLYLYDTSPACTFGIHDEFISAGRLDDLSMVHAALEALLATGGESPEVMQVMAIFDNEETGSSTKQGAGSPFLATILQRIALQQSGTMEAFLRGVEQSFMVSADNAHAWHPNYSEKYDPTNHPVLGGGPVIKFNAAQKYASDAFSAAVFASVCEEVGVACQRFVNHSDVAGGSTLGNILTASLPLSGVDMGNPILGMHSVRETGAVADHVACIKAFTKFYSL